jgi:hypothetical protein
MCFAYEMTRFDLFKMMDANENTLKIFKYKEFLKQWRIVNDSRDSGV